ncbi:hypothetical protein [Salinibacterium sp. ZJ70]|uniref:hypothetical protein n=1 Tax=Salinibacterium sp. ZJ70 TaxID=2708084 RepID=UPI0014216937|nr:hypothetical protein [Salinibacterium sp. ZJ70]
MSDETAAHYRILLPPGWVRMRGDDQAQEALVRVIDERVETLAPEQRPRVRALMRRSAEDAIGAARERGALELILSFATVQGIPIPASIVLLPLPVPEDDRRPADEILLSLGRGGAHVIEIDGIPAMRRVVDTPATGPDPAHRAIHYMLRHPHSGRWLAFSASILTSDDEGYGQVLEALETLVGAMMSTIRFSNGGSA